MALFGKKTPNEEACCASNPDAAKAEDAAILVLGAGCPKCRQLEASVKAALAELGTGEALGKHQAKDAFESYSAGTEQRDRIHPDAVRLMKQI